ncbi:MAG: phosphoribosylformylglycinamidine synthase I [Planctomycetales bacterium 4484_113]|nr:MAG: phosphoribosylformylglycinamidine synthase I [Planctomycetales bacterium 4484_113]
MNAGVITFLGSNCDDDALYALGDVLGADARRLFYSDRELPELDLIVLPGGFSYGDYLRCGAIARFSPIMPAVREFADAGGLVLGICNGFQILCEAGMLPGALVKNDCLEFRCQWARIRVENNELPFTQGLTVGEVLKIPIAHSEGNYFAPPEVLAELEEHHRVAFRYCDENGELTPEANPNGSLNHIAGITNERGNVLGMMPHPERACEDTLGSADGMRVLGSIARWLKSASPA